MTDDPTRLTNQPALTTSTGRSWLIIGGLFAAIALAVLIPMAWLPSGAVAVVGAVIVAVLYVGMVVVRLTVPAGRRRLGLLAAGMLGIAAVALVCAGIVAFGAWRA